MIKWLFDNEFTLSGKIAWGTLLSLVFLVPLIFSVPSSSGGAPFTADVFDTPKVWLLRVGVMILFAAWGSDVLFNGGKIRYSKAVLSLYGVLAAVFVVSTFFSIEPMQSFLGKYRRYDGLWSFALYGILLWVTMQYASSMRRIKQIMQVLSVSSVIVAGYGLMQALGLEIFTWGTMLFEQNRSFSTYGNPNLLAGFIAFGIFINLGLALSEQERLLRGYYWIATLLNAAVAITAFSRSLWVASIVGVIVLIVYMIRFRPHLQIVDYGFMGATVAVVGAFIVRSLSSTHKVMNFANRVSSIFDFGAGSAVTRFEIWDTAWRATLDRPFLGWGADTFRMIFRLFQPASYNHNAGYRSVADNAHNYPLQVAAGIGIIGAVLLYALQFWILALAARYCWKLPKYPHAGTSRQKQVQAQQMYDCAIASRICYVGIIAAVIAYSVHLFFGLSLPGATFLLWICFGALLAPIARQREVQPLSRPIALAGCALLIALVCISTIFATRLLWADHLFARAQVAQYRNDFNEALPLINRSVRLSPRNDQYAIAQAEYTVKAAAQGMISLDDAAGTIANLTDSFSNEYDVYLIALWAYQAFSQADDAYIEKGLTVSGQAIERFPQGLAVRFSYAELLLGQGYIDDAVEQLEFCVAADPKFKEAQRLLKELRTAQKKSEVSSVSD